MTTKEKVDEARQYGLEVNRRLVKLIVDSSDTPQEKTVKLLAFIAESIVNTNYKLDDIYDELFVLASTTDLTSS